MTDEKALEEHTVAELREIARDTGKIEGRSTMKKADLVSAIRAVQGEVVEKIPEEKVSETPNEPVETVEDVPSETIEKVPEEKVSESPEGSAETVENEVSSKPAKAEPDKKTVKVPEKPVTAGPSLKVKMGILKQKRDELMEKGDRRGINRFRKRINRLKKRTRRLTKVAS